MMTSSAYQISRGACTSSRYLASQCCACFVQADIFSFGVLMYEVLCGCITSQLVVGPTGNMRAAEVYAAKASHRQLSSAERPELQP